jgi:hypothetical protein
MIAAGDCDNAARSLALRHGAKPVPCTAYLESADGLQILRFHMDRHSANLDDK